MCVLRRLDAVLEPTKRAVLDTKDMLDKAKITEQFQSQMHAKIAVSKLHGFCVE
jgi:hypothetical protein